MTWCIIQVLPFTPHGWHHPLWAETAKALGTDYRGSISLAPEGGLLALERFLTYVLMGLGVYVVAQDEKRAKWLLRGLFYVGTAICAYAVLVYVTGNTHVLWYEKWAYLRDATGTFVSRNQFADYAGLTLLTGFALAWGSWRNAEEKVQWLLRAGLPYAAAGFIALLALWLSHSRAGFAATAVGGIVFIFAYLVYQRRPVMAVTLAGAVALLGIFLFTTVAPQVGRFEYLGRDHSSNDRLKVWSVTTDAIEGNPLFGHGFGSFETAFRLYRGGDIAMNFDRAHSDILETAFDLGIPGALVLAVAFALMLSALWHGVRKRNRHGVYACLGLAASAMMLSHGAVDFTLQNPGSVATWMILLGCGLAQSWGSRERG
jgi:O-antigen ligase